MKHLDWILLAYGDLVVLGAGAVAAVTLVGIFVVKMVA
jgi:hypothetical protein